MRTFSSWLLVSSIGELVVRVFGDALEMTPPDIGAPGATECPVGSVAVTDASTCKRYAATYSRATSGQFCSNLTRYSAECEGGASPEWCKHRPAGCWTDVGASNNCFFFNSASIAGASYPLAAPVCIKSTRTRPRLGNYGFLSYFGMTPVEIVKQVDDMFDQAGIRDVQFYDWFDNYAGRYQNYTLRDDTRGKAPVNDWWRNPVWSDPWDSHMLVRRDTLMAAIQRTKLRGGRAWAYLQVVGSEHWNLTGIDDQSCSPKLDPWVADQSPYNVDAEGTICKLMNATGWVMQESPTRIFPTYAANGALAVYQVNSWIGILEEFGFDGVHWDTLGVKAADYAVESYMLTEFVTVAGRLLKKHNMLQTLNQVDTHWWNPSLFTNGILAFPYSEIWFPFWHDKFREKVAGFEGAVIAAYPGTEMNGCPCITSDDCSLAAQRGVHENCPSNMTQEMLLDARWKDACDHGHRYVIVGNGLRRLVTEFFPWTVPLAPHNLALIQNYTCDLSHGAATIETEVASGLSKWFVALVVIGSTLALTLISVLAGCIYKRHWRHEKSTVDIVPARSQV